MYSNHRRPGGSLIPLIQVLSLVLVFALPVVWGSKVFTSSPTHYDRVVVHAGDTVWSLVSRRAGNGDDLGEAVYQAAQINHLRPDSQLEPGSVLLLPKH
jgi:hypothetical protein